MSIIFTNVKNIIVVLYINQRQKYNKVFLIKGAIEDFTLRTRGNPSEIRLRNFDLHNIFLKFCELTLSAIHT